MGRRTNRGIPQTCRSIPAGRGDLSEDSLRYGHRRPYLSRVTDGSIILLHDGGIDRSQTVATLDEVLGELKARGYSFGRLCD